MCYAKNEDDLFEALGVAAQSVLEKLRIERDARLGADDEPIRAVNAEIFLVVSRVEVRFAARRGRITKEASPVL